MKKLHSINIYFGVPISLLEYTEKYNHFWAFFSVQLGVSGKGEIVPHVEDGHVDQHNTAWFQSDFCLSGANCASEIWELSDPA